MKYLVEDCDIDNFKVGIEAGNEFECNVNRDGVFLYGEL